MSNAEVDTFTTTEAAVLLTERGVRAKDGGPVRPATVIQWINRGQLEATKEGHKYRGQWRIPRPALDAFTPPQQGRPRKGHDDESP